MNTDRIFTAVAALFCASALSFGQNLNPTVEVTNIYEGNSSRIRKPSIDMNVPDSLLRFDLDFNYEVFDNPYQGAYSFKPYTLNMKPEKDAWRGKGLYVKVGAGYSFRPVFDVVYSPALKGRFQMSLYASHRSYLGDYLEIAAKVNEANPDERTKLVSTGGTYKGHDMLSTAGFEGRVKWENTDLAFGVGYYGLGSKDTIVTRYYNAAKFGARIKTTRNEGKYFHYDLGIKGSIGADGLDYAGHSYLPWISDGKSVLMDTYFALDGDFGVAFENGSKVLLGVEGRNHSYSDMFETGCSLLSFTPKYVLSKGRWDLSAGLRMESLLKGNSSDTLSYRPMNQHEGRFLYPDVRVSFNAIEGYLSLYAVVDGGGDMNQYSSLVERNHHLTPAFAYGGVPFMDNSIVGMNVKAGFRGNVASRLTYDISAGGVSVENGLAEALYPLGAYVDTPVVGKDGYSYLANSVYYQDYDLIYADAALGWKSNSVEVNGVFRYRCQKFTGLGSEYHGPQLLKAPLFSGRLDATFHVNPRVYAGLVMEASGARKGTATIELPGYLDLGVRGGYKFNRKLGLWLESGNLLCDKIQRNPLYCERGPWVTVGASLSL